MPDIPKVNYSDFFQTATSGAPEPYFCQSRLIDIPTGLGKTAGVVLA